MALVYAVGATWAVVLGGFWLVYLWDKHRDREAERRLEQFNDLERLYRMDAIEPRRRLT